MDAKQLLVLGAATLASSLVGSAEAEVRQEPYVRVAEIEIDPAQLEPYKAAVKEQIEAAVRLEPGVLALYSVSDKENPARVFVCSRWTPMLPPTRRISRRLISRIQSHHARHGEIAHASRHRAHPACREAQVKRLPDIH